MVLISVLPTYITIVLIKSHYIEHIKLVISAFIYKHYIIAVGGAGSSALPAFDNGI